VGLPFNKKISDGFKVTLSPMISTRLHLAALLDMKQSSAMGKMNWHSFFVHDHGLKYIISPHIQWENKPLGLLVQGLHVSDRHVLENYARFAPNVTWLIPLNMRLRYDDAFSFAAGVDTFKDFGDKRPEAVFPYFKREPWVTLGFADEVWGDYFLKADAAFSHYSPTRSFSDLVDKSDFKVLSAHITRTAETRLGRFEGNVGYVTSHAGGVGEKYLHIARGLLSWRNSFYYQDVGYATQLGMILSNRTQQQIPLLESRPIPLDYNQLFSWKRFTLETRIGDCRDIDGLIEIDHPSFQLGLGMRYALRLHSVSVADGVTLYDPLLKKHLSPLLVSYRIDQRAWTMSGHVNLGEGDDFQYYSEIDYRYKMLNLGIFGFRLPIDYAAYKTPQQVRNVEGLGIVSKLHLSERWTFDGQWYTQTDLSDSGFSIMLKYNDCCLQVGFGIKKYLISPQADVHSRLQWMAQIDFDTSSGIINTIG
jgi:hypothetical protein